jgi:hypothetical protein
LWDGSQWTPQVSAGGPPLRTRLPEGAPIYGPAIWVLALSPLLGAVLVWFIRIDWSSSFDFINTSEQSGGNASIPIANPMSMFGPGYWVVEFVSLAATAGLVVLAYRDYQYLGRVGLVRPFHWAWAFLNPMVYVIGRGVILRRVAAPRGLAPTWTAVAAYASSMVVIGVWLAVFFASFAQQVPTGFK